LPIARYCLRFPSQSGKFYLIFLSPLLHEKVSLIKSNLFMFNVFGMPSFLRLTGLLLAFSPLFFSGFAHADLEASERLRDELKDMKAFQSEFTQTVLNSRGVMQQSTQGEMAAKRPGLFYWQTFAPFEQTLVSDGQQLWSYDPDLEQVTVQAVAQSLSDTPALLFSGEVQGLSENYEIDSVQLDDHTWQYQLTPKQPDSLFEELRLTFSKNTLVQMHMLDSLGSRSSLEFNNVKINGKLDDALFQFTPPEGVDVITQ